MKRLFSAKTLAVAAVALGAVGLASAAHARSDVTFSIGVNAPYGYVQPAYGYAQPAYGYVEPAPVYIDPQPVYVQPQPVYVQPQTVYYGHDRRWEHRGRWERRGPWGDADHDGVPNRYDRAPLNPYRR
jgi:hypothetical protein